MSIQIQPSRLGRLILAFHKGRWWILVFVLGWAYLSLIVISEMRMREDGLSKRMTLAAEMLIEPPTNTVALMELLKRNGAEPQAALGRSSNGNLMELVDLLKEWDELKPSADPRKTLGKLAEFLSPPKRKKERVPPPILVVGTSPEAGDYADYGVDIRVSSNRKQTKEEIKKDAQRFLDAKGYWEEQGKPTWAIADRMNPQIPSDEYSFYDFKRQRLNHIVMGGVMASLGILGILSNSILGGLSLPSWRSVLRDRTLEFKNGTAAKTPFNTDTSILETRWSWGVLLIAFITLGSIIAVQILQIGERKELWIEAWLNHPTSFIVIFSFGLAFILGLHEPRRSEDCEFFADEYIRYFKTFSLSLICIPFSACVVITYSLKVLYANDPSRAISQVAISLLFSLLALYFFWRVSRRVFGIKCRVSENDKEEVTLSFGDYFPKALIPYNAEQLLSNIFTILGAIFLAIGF